MTDNADLINAITKQNDALVALINKSEDAWDLIAADKQVTFCEGVWLASGYGYKVKGLRNRIRCRADHLCKQEELYLSKLRKNDRTRLRSQANLDLLIAIGVNADRATDPQVH